MYSIFYCISYCIVDIGKIRYWVLEWSYTHTWAYTVHAHTHLKHLDRLQKVPPSVTLVFLKRGLKYFLCPLCAFTYLSTPFDLLTVSVPRTELFTSYTIWTTLSLSGLLSAIFLELQPKTVEWTQTYKSLLRHLKNRSKNLLKLFFWLLHITSTLKTPFFWKMIRVCTQRYYFKGISLTQVP